MSVVVGREMRQGSERKGVLVQILRFANERDDKVAAADIVREIAIERAAERIVAKVLDNTAAVGVGMRDYQIFGRGRREPFQQEGLDGAVPGGIDNGLVRQDRVRPGVPAGEERQQAESGASQPGIIWSGHFLRSTFRLT